jgi:hypothetical protein
MNFYKLLNKFKKPAFSIGIILFIIILFNRFLLADVIYESDDYKHHAVRTASYYLAVKQKALPVRWGPNLNQGYGYPSFNHMYHAPYISGAFLHAVGFSIQESLNFTVLLSLLLGAVGCYFFVKSYFKTKPLSELWSILLSLFFILNPYTLLNVYWRGAAGELIFYALVPFFLLFVKKLLIKTNYFYVLLTSIASSLLIISHLPSMLLLAPVAITFIFSELKTKFNFKKISSVLLSGVLGLLLSAWYWIPAYFEQWMVAYQKGNSLTQYSTQFASILTIFDLRKDFFSSDYFLLVIQVGWVSLFALLIGFYLFKLTKKSFSWVALYIVSIFLLSNYSQFLWDKFQFLQYIQYPWRFLWIITVASIMILINFILEKNIKLKWKKIASVLVALGILFSSQAYIQIKGTSTRSDFDWYHPTFETGSSFDEHQPIWSKIPYHFPEELMYVNATESALITLNNLEEYVHELSDINPKIVKFDGTNITYEVSPDKDIIALQKRLFYPGWEAHLDKKNIEFVQNIPEYEGVLAVPIPAQKSLVEISFTGYTKLRKFAEYLSILTLLSFIVSAMIAKYYDK